ncbi:hypothetical protein FF38_03552 [Lucilia cuprina]|uniref:Uncharacterized protein n=1 Tax=Lucilia cuprina TaxID=7375 RepID=A0A0L0CHX1_LUCCU|nr:hypothetical protein FF38_03552 [Lucilia cuprina]
MSDGFLYCGRASSASTLSKDSFEESGAVQKFAELDLSFEGEHDINVESVYGQKSKSSPPTNESKIYQGSLSIKGRPHGSNDVFGKPQETGQRTAPKNIWPLWQIDQTSFSPKEKNDKQVVKVGTQKGVGPSTSAACTDEPKIHDKERHPKISGFSGYDGADRSDFVLAQGEVPRQEAQTELISGDEVVQVGTQKGVGPSTSAACRDNRIKEDSVLVAEALRVRLELWVLKRGPLGESDLASPAKAVLGNKTSSKVIPGAKIEGKPPAASPKGSQKWTVSRAGCGASTSNEPHKGTTKKARSGDDQPASSSKKVKKSMSLYGSLRTGGYRHGI